MISFPMTQKVLFVHLLRLGDLLILLPSIMGFRKTYPKSEIHLLINDNCSILSSLLERYVDKIHYFQRDQIQKEIVDPNANLFSPYYEIDSFTQKLNSENYDYVINFTQNYLSAYLCSLIQANEKLGLLYENDELILKGDAFKDINSQENNKELARTHFVDAFFQALKIENKCSQSWRLLGLNSQIKRPYILFQIHTNEPTKTFSTHQWVKLFEAMKPFVHDYDLRILCAPNEEQKTIDMLSLVDADLKNNIHINACSINRALELIEDAELLVSVDTSIKHLSNFTGTRVLEISLGSSDIYRTGVYKPGSYIIQPKVGCLPCSHSVGCTMKEHLCANSINLDSLSQLIFSLAKDPLSIDDIYPEFELDAHLFSVETHNSSFKLKAIVSEINNYNDDSNIGDRHESNT